MNEKDQSRKTETKGISRRDFLKGAAAGTVAVAAATLVPPLVSPGGTVQAAAVERAPVGQVDPAMLRGDVAPLTPLNPQDYSIRDTESDFSTLFTPITIGGYTFSHRLVKSCAGAAKGPTHVPEGTDTGGRGSGYHIMREYHVNMAKGGMEFQWIDGLMWGNMLNPEHEGAWRQLVEECGRYGCKLGAQTGLTLGGVNMQSTAEELRSGIEQTKERVQWLKDMGFVGVELHGASGLSRNLLSRFWNTRTDEFGRDSIENRGRLMNEHIKAAREVGGPDFIIQILMSCTEELDNFVNLRGDSSGMGGFLANAGTPAPNGFRNTGLAAHDAATVEEMVELAKSFERNGASCMHLRPHAIEIHIAGMFDLYWILNGYEGFNGLGWSFDFDRHFQGMGIGNHGGAGFALDMAQKFKEQLTIPVGTVAFNDPAAAPEFFEGALRDGKVDFLLFKRPLDVDCEYVNKLREGRRDEILLCMRCCHCHQGGGERLDPTFYCRVNAMFHRVYNPMHIEGSANMTRAESFGPNIIVGGRNHPTSYELPPRGGAAKDVMVIGGGPAGMECARVAAQRGHNVTLYERTSQLGGLMRFAETIKGPHENFSRYIKWHERQLELAGVNVVLGQNVDAAFIGSQDPDALVVATGALYDTLQVANNDGSVPIVPYEGFHVTNMGRRCLVWGGGAIGFDAALYLTKFGTHVDVATQRTTLSHVLLEQGAHPSRMLTMLLASRGTRIFWGAGTNIVGIENGRVRLAIDAGVEKWLECDTILDASQMLANTSLADASNVGETYVIGDARYPFNIAYAVHEGNDIGRTI